MTAATQAATDFADQSITMSYLVTSRRLPAAIVGVIALLGSLAFAPVPASAAPPSMLVVGDSVILGAKSQIEAEFGTEWDLTFDAKVSRSTYAGLNVVRSHADVTGELAIIALGYNDGYSGSVFRPRMRAILDELTEVDTVIWLNMRSAGTYNYSSANYQLELAKADYPNLIVADWHTASWQVSRPTGSDGLHLLQAGAVAMTELIVGTLPDIDPDARCAAIDLPEQNPDMNSARGYWLLSESGSVTAVDAPHYGDLSDESNQAISINPTPTGDGYWIVDSQGIVTAFGDAVNLGDMAEFALNAPIIELIANPTGSGYWLLASDGGIFAFGEAPFLGSTGNINLNAPAISMAPTPTGEGYWIVAADGGVFSFGDAEFMGSTGSQLLNSPVSSMAVSPDGSGYWLYASDGGVFSFGGVAFHGSVPGMSFCNNPVAVQLRVTASGRGYWVATKDGRVLPFGDAYHRGDATAQSFDILDMAIRRG